LCFCLLCESIVVEFDGKPCCDDHQTVHTQDIDVGGNKDSIIVQEIEVNSLLTEYLESPLGVDKAIPRVSWKIQTKDRGNQNRNSPVAATATDITTATTRYIRRQIFQQSYQLHVSSLSTSSQWKDCGWVASNDTSLVPLECKGLTPISTSDMNVSWKVSVKLDDGSVIESGVVFFRTGIFGPWNAQWISGWGWDNVDEKQRTLFRREFALTKPNIDTSPIHDNAVNHYATLFVAGLGYNHVYLNGIKVGDHQLDPGWTNYTKKVWYSTYDVTNLLHFDDGEELATDDDSNDDNTNNVIAVMLGNGWWSCGPPPGTGQNYCTRDPPQLILQLHVDGQPIVLSDETWLASADSPILYNSLYNGEVYDSRIAKRIKGWNTLYYDDSDWEMATLATNDATRAILAPQLFEPIRHISTRSPISIVVAGNGDNLTQVVDFGQNQAAVVRLKQFFCPSGTTVVLRHAELIIHPPYGEYDNTTIYVDNLRSAKATDYYICNGDPKGESYTPTFTQHGFRYVEITGLNYTLDPSDVESVELHTDVKQTSFIQFADPLLNKIQHMVIWGLKSNFMSVQTDCNQRDERKGWMGDAALTAEAAVLSYGMGAFYTHWLTQMVENQSPDDGSMPNIVPPMGRTEGAPNWQTAYPMILWVMMTYHGDRQLIFQHHDSLVRYFDFLESSYHKTGLKNFRTGFGDWVPPMPHPKADPHLMGAFAFLGDLKLGIDLFQYSNHPDSGSQVERLTKLRTKLSPEFHYAFFNATSGVYMSGLQTEQALPLYLGVVPNELQNSVLSNLVDDIEITQKGHTTSGIIGIKYAMEVLSTLDRGDVALDLALQRTYPSWGYMVNSQYEPATTVWELWESDFAGPGMNSRNHHMFGSVTGWFYKYVAGIQPLDPGFSRVQIQPNLLRHKNFTVTVSTPRGRISLNYLKQNNNEEGNSIEFIYEITLPPCTSGTFYIPIAIDDKEFALSNEIKRRFNLARSAVSTRHQWYSSCRKGRQ